MFKRITGLIILSLAFVSSAQAFQISSGISNGSSMTVKSTEMQVRGTVDKNSYVNRSIDYADPVTGQRSQGNLNEHTQEMTYVVVNSQGSGMSFSGYAGGSNSVGALTVGYQVSGGVDLMHTDSRDTSVTDVDAVSITNVNITQGGNYVGSSSEVIVTDTRINRNNLDRTDSQGTWGEYLVYAQ